APALTDPALLQHEVLQAAPTQHVAHGEAGLAAADDQSLNVLARHGSSPWEFLRVVSSPPGLTATTTPGAGAVRPSCRKGEVPMKNDPRFQPFDASRTPRFADVATFLRARRMDIGPDIDIALVGVPFDMGV